MVDGCCGVDSVDVRASTRREEYADDVACFVVLCVDDFVKFVFDGLCVDVFECLIEDVDDVVGVFVCCGVICRVRRGVVRIEKSFARARRRVCFVIVFVVV